MSGNQPRKPGRCDHGMMLSVYAQMITAHACYQ
jgi:hypothetical protein